jgi:hypothetical protein
MATNNNDNLLKQIIEAENSHDIRKTFFRITIAISIICDYNCCNAASARTHPSTLLTYDGRPRQLAKPDSSFQTRILN